MTKLKMGAGSEGEEDGPGLPSTFSSTRRRSICRHFYSLVDAHGKWAPLSVKLLYLLWSQQTTARTEVSDGIEPQFRSRANPWQSAVVAIATLGTCLSLTMSGGHVPAGVCIPPTPSVPAAGECCLAEESPRPHPLSRFSAVSAPPLSRLNPADSAAARQACGCRSYL